jgi:hypothetical protein
MKSNRQASESKALRPMVRRSIRGVTNERKCRGEPWCVTMERRMKCRKQTAVCVWNISVLVAVCLAGATQTIACKRDSAKPDSAPNIQSAAPKREEVDAPWYVGTWSGNYDAKVSPSTAAMPKRDKPKQEDNETASIGPGVIELVIAADRTVTGNSKGALGELRAAGELDGETLRVWLMSDAVSKEKQNCWGNLVASQKNGKFEGSLHGFGRDISRASFSAIALNRAGRKEALGAPGVTH